MTTTAIAPPIDAANVEHLISLFTLRSIGARDLMVDASGALGFFYGRPSTRRTLRMQIEATGPDTYAIQAGHVDSRTRVWVVEETRQASTDELRDTIRELA
jgi:hypothetical protein